MTENAIAVTARRMGRPPLNVKPTMVRLTEDVRQRIEACVGPNRMAVFIREAVEEKLQRDERRKTDKEEAAGVSE